MHRKRLTALLAVFAVSAVGLSLMAGPAASKGNARLAARVTTITVTAGKPTELAFKLSKTSALPVGTVIFKVTNQGALSHDFKLCTKAVTSSKANTCTGKGTKLLQKGQTALLTVAITKAGQYEYMCTVPGHASAGMKGLVGVGVKATATPVATAVPTGGYTGPTVSNAGASGPPAATETLGGDPAAGAAVFASAGCGSCHTLKAAGATGQVGPNLDQTADGQDTIVQRVTSGINVMPAFGATLSGTDIKNVAAYVYSSTHTT